MADTKIRLVLDQIAGRNDTDPPLSLPDGFAPEVLNVDWKGTPFAHKRGGAIAVATTGGTAFNSNTDFIFRHVPGGSETAAEFWAWDGDGAPLKRMAGGTAFADVTLDDAISTNVYDVVGVSLNGKLFLAYDSAQDRLHVYDPNLASARVRRVGFATPGAPTVANTGAGAYPATLRYYRVRWLQLNGTTIIRRSEPGASQSFTPSGAGTAARVTQPTVASEGETHWEVEASTDNTTFYRLSQVVIGTTTYDDSALVATYSSNPLSDTASAHTRFPSVKYLLTDGNRLLGAGAWEASGANSGGRNSRIWYTPVLGSADTGDDERVVLTTSQKNYVDLNENDGGFITGLGGPLNGVPLAFKYRQIWKLLPTGDVATPYQPRRLSDAVGCISHKTIAMGEDEIGLPALYFLSHRGPYRVGLHGLQYLGRDNEVMWRSMNLGAASIAAHSVYYPDLHQWWLWIATGSNNTPNIKMMFDVQRGFPDANGAVRGGWAQHTGNSAAARCSCLFSNTLGATMSRDLKPHVGRDSNSIYKCDTSDTNDNGTNFQAYVEPKPLRARPGYLLGVGKSVLTAAAQSGVTITQTIIRDYGLATRTATAVLTASGSETRVVVPFEASDESGANVIQTRIGDAAAASNTWTLDEVVIPVSQQEAR